jgi:hypothetical protein
LQIDATDSRLLGPSLPVTIKNALENEQTTANFHDYCMRPEVNIIFPSILVFNYIFLLIKELHS